MRMNRITRAVVCVGLAGVALTAAAPVAAGAQSSSEQHDRHVFTARDWWRLGAFATGTALTVPFDRRLANQFEQPAWHRRGIVVHGAETVRALGDPGALILSVGSYAAGRLTQYLAV